MKRFKNIDAIEHHRDVRHVLRWKLGLGPEPRRRSPAAAAVPFVENDGQALRGAREPSLTWLGHATYLLQMGGASVLTDPVLSPRVALVRRNIAPGLTHETLPPIDVVTVSHNHLDHMDGPTLTRLGPRPTYVVPTGLSPWFKARGLTSVIELGWFESCEVRGVKVTLVPAQHWSQRGLTDTDETLWGGFVYEAEGRCAYHSGDTAYFSGFAKIAERFRKIDAAMLPIGAYDPRWFMRPQHMNPDDAVQAFVDLGAARFFAMHWGTFKLTDEPLDEPPMLTRELFAARGLDGSRLHIPAVGETVRLLPRPELRPSLGSALSCVAMPPIRTRGDLAILLERHMAASASRPGAPGDDEIEGRTALKTYLLEAHGKMRQDPRGALGEVAVPMGLELEQTAEQDLIEITQGETTLWYDASNRRFPRVYSVGPVKDTDRVTMALVSGSGLLDSVWLPPRMLESLAKTTHSSMVLFSLRHDRRPLRRAPDTSGIDSVTLRLWGPRAKDTLDKLRGSEVLPAATSVFSVRLRAGDEQRYCYAEVFHNGKVTAVGNSFFEHERMLAAVVEQAADLSTRLEEMATPRRVHVPVHWTVDDLEYAVGRMFSSAEPFRLWGIPDFVSPDTFRVRAIDADVGRGAVFIVDPRGVSIELGPKAPASVLVRFVSNLQYHVNADLDASALSPEPLLQLSLPTGGEGAAFSERSSLHEVARAVLTEACGMLVRGTLTVTAEELVKASLGERPTEALVDLCRKVMAEAAAHEWRTKIYPVQGSDGRIGWRFLDPLPVDASARLREMVRMNRYAQQLVARLSGMPIARWLQLSLFGPEALVPAVHDDDL